MKKCFEEGDEKTLQSNFDVLREVTLEGANVAANHDCGVDECETNLGERKRCERGQGTLERD